jgi:hypothetical protein
MEAENVTTKWRSIQISNQPEKENAPPPADSRPLDGAALAARDASGELISRSVASHVV